MNDSLTQITILLDRSGSMADVRDATIAGFNEFVKGQKVVPGECDLALIQFDSENAYDLTFEDSIAKVPDLTTKTYVPRGGTPLHDALGRAITQLGSKLEKLAEKNRPSKVVIVTMTDGLENSSHEYTSAKVAEMIKHQREAYQWEFIFLGANQDAILTGEKLNIPANNSLTYAASNIGTVSAFASSSHNMQSFRVGGGSRSLTYSGLQREQALEQDEEEHQKKVKKGI